MLRRGVRCLQVISRSNVAVAMAQESLRVNASVANLPRTALVDTRVGNIEVSKGTTIVCALQAVRTPLPPAPTPLPTAFTRACFVYGLRTGKFIGTA